MGRLRFTPQQIIAARRGGDRLAFCLSIAASLVVAGCSTAGSYQRPDVAPPVQFRAEAAPLPPAPAGPRSGWWTGFGSAELDQLVTRALSSNNDLAAAEDRVAEARAQARIAGAGQYPTLSIADGAAAQTGDPTSTTPGDAHRRSSSVTLAAQAGYELDFWGRNRALAQSGQAQVSASAYERDTLAITTAATTADLYFQVLSLAERVRTAQQIAADARRVLALVEGQQQVGVATVLQVEQQRTVAAGFEASVPVLVQQQERANHALAILLALPPRAYAPQGTTLDGVAIPDVQAGLPSELLLRRPDIRAAEARLSAAHFDIRAARAAFLPSLSLTGAGGVGSNLLADFLSPAGYGNAAAALLAPVFDGGRLSGQLGYDKAHAQELAAAYRQTALAAFGDVEDALTARQRVAEAERSAEVAVSAARHAAALSEGQFRLGVIDLLTLLDTQRALYQAQDNLLQLRLQRLQAAIALYRALGGSADTVQNS
jgi:NodT family efflux transporter outer membrane factor (OMF) lipoprotein